MTGKILFGALVFLAVAVPPKRAGADETDSLPQIMQTLATAKSEGEDAVQKFNMLPDNTPSLRIDAMQSYSSARADFNGLIERLITDQDPDTAALSASYHQDLSQALQAEEAFLTFVQTQLKRPRPPGTKGFLPGALLGGAGSLFDGLAHFVDSAVHLHQEMTRESDEHRKQVEQELDKLRWQQFSKIQ